MKNNKKKESRITKKFLQKQREMSVIRHIHNGVYHSKGVTRKEKIKKYLSESIVPNTSSLDIARFTQQKFEECLIDIVSHTNKKGMYRLSKPLLILAILVKQKKEKGVISKEMIDELLGKKKEELITECKK